MGTELLWMLRGRQCPLRPVGVCSLRRPRSDAGRSSGRLYCIAELVFGGALGPQRIDGL